MTENDKRLTETLTEGAYAPATPRAYRCPLTHSEWGCACPESHHRFKHCQCVNCVTARYWRIAHNQAQSDDPKAYDDPLERHQRYIDAATEHVRLAEEIIRKRTLHQQNKANALSKLGPWEFTLTYSPKEHGWMAEQAEEAMREAVERLCRYYADEIIEFHAVGERTQMGQPHVHAWYHLKGGRKITTKSFKRAYPIWNEKRKLGRGHEGGHHAPIKRTSDFAGYIEKDLDTSWLILNITNASEADVQEAHDQVEDESSQDGTASPPDPPA